MVAIIMEAMRQQQQQQPQPHSKKLDISAVALCSSTCLGHHLSFQTPKKLEAVLMVDMIVLLALIPQETMMALHLVHNTITT
jgi:hypothetical protein